MNVTHTVDLGDGHLIEIGAATWDEEATSVRDRYPTSSGGFSPHSSSEIPLHDFEPLIEAIAKYDLLDSGACARMIQVLAESVARQSAS